MAVGGRHRVPLPLLLLLTAWVTAATASGLLDRRYLRHADFYRTRHRPQVATPRSGMSRHHTQFGTPRRGTQHQRATSSHQNSVPVANRAQNQNFSPPREESLQRRHQGSAAVRWEQQRSHRQNHRRRSAAREAIYHGRYPATLSIRRSDTQQPTWLDDTSSALVSEPERELGREPGWEPHAAASETQTFRRPPPMGQISVQIGQNSQNYSVRNGVVIGAEHVKLWRTEQVRSSNEFSELKASGGEVWLNNGTALYRSVDISDYEVFTNEISDTKTTQVDKEKEPKFFFPIFTIIRFPNDPCQSSQQEGFSASGTCYLPQECSSRGGLARGSCAIGFGVCCVFTLSCGGTTDKSGTFFVNPEFPNSGSTARACSFSVKKSSPDVTQIRLDFVEFTMAGPTDGSCNTDTFSVSGQNTNAPVPTLCGQNTGQHVYVEVGERSGPIQLRAVTGPGSSERRWRIRVTQYVRGAEGAAPASCLQYHTGQLGSIESFNYPATGTDAGYLNQLNYMICIRKESGFCSITYGVDRFDQFSTPEQFEIFNVNVRIVNGVMVVRSTVPAGQAGVGPIQCPDDYILLSADRLCGDRLNDGSVNSQLTQNADVTDDTGGQFTVKFVTNESTIGRGFKLYFRQNPCRSRRSYAT